MLYITEMMIDKLSPHNLKFRAAASTDGAPILFSCQMTSQTHFHLYSISVSYSRDIINMAATLFWDEVRFILQSYIYMPMIL